MLNSWDIIMDKVVRDGKVAVLISPGFGAGWYTWHGIEELLFDPVVVDMVENGRVSEVETYVNKKYPDEHPYFGGVEELVVKWVPQGERFRIEEYDGSEKLRLESQEKWLSA